MEPDKKYTKFNVFGDDGENHVITTKEPMTCEQVQLRYKWALAVGGIE